MSPGHREADAALIDAIVQDLRRSGRDPSRWSAVQSLGVETLRSRGLTAGAEVRVPNAAGHKKADVVVQSAGRLPIGVGDVRALMKSMAKSKGNRIEDLPGQAWNLRKRHGTSFAFGALYILNAVCGSAKNEAVGRRHSHVVEEALCDYLTDLRETEDEDRAHLDAACVIVIDVTRLSSGPTMQQGALWDDAASAVDVRVVDRPYFDDFTRFWHRLADAALLHRPACEGV